MKGQDSSRSARKVSPAESGKQRTRAGKPKARVRAEYLGPARRRPIVLSAALNVFAEGGFADASMEALAKRAGTTKPVLYDCFPKGKEEIYAALLEREEERFRAHMTGVLASTGRMRLRDAIHAGLSAFLDYADVNPDAFKVLFSPHGTADPGIVERHTRVREEIVKIITNRSMTMGESAGTPPVLVELHNRAIVAIAEEMARWWLAEKPIERERMVFAMTNWMMKGFEGTLPREMIESYAFGPRTD